MGGTLLVTGTSIGVGMLALPVATASGGFIPSFFVYVICWVFMLCSGTYPRSLYLDAQRSEFDHAVDAPSRKMGRHILLVSVFIPFSCLMVAHIAGGAGIISDLTGGKVPSWLGTVIYVALFSPVVYFGALWVDRFNLALIAGVAITYLVFAGSSAGYIVPSYLTRMDWGKIWWAASGRFYSFRLSDSDPHSIQLHEPQCSKGQIRHYCGHGDPAFDLYSVGVADFRSCSSGRRGGTFTSA